MNTTQQQTYEHPLAASPEQRIAHFSDEDQRRFYGLDFGERLVRAGLRVATFRVSPEDEVRYGQLRDEWLTIAGKRLRRQLSVTVWKPARSNPQREILIYYGH